MTAKTQIFCQNQRKINTLSNLLDNFDENYDGGIGLRDSIIDIIETRNVDVPEARKVSDEAVFSVAERALVSSATLPIDVQHFNVIREVTNFVTFASEGSVSEAVNKHADLLPVNHPNSTAAHEFSMPELRQLRATWVAADSRITDESARAIVAAVYGSNPNSLDFHYNMIRLNSLGDQIPSDLRIMPIIAFGNPYAGKNSFWHRKQRAEGQRRDEEGQFAEMGGGARVYVKMPMGNIISVVGKIAGIPENDPKGIDLEITDVPGITPGIYTVPSDMTKFFKAILPSEAIEKSSPVGPGLGVNFIDIADMVRKDLPTSWYTTESGASPTLLENSVKPDQNYATGDGYRVAAYDKLTDALQKRVSEAQGKFGSMVLNTKGTDALENDKPVYELISTKRGQEEVVGYAQDWSGVQQMTTAEDTNYPDAENEPLQEDVQPEVIAELPEVEATPETVATEGEEDPEDAVEAPSFDPLESLPNDWRYTGTPDTFISSDGRYAAEYGERAVGSEITSTFDLNSGDKFDGEGSVSLPGVMNIYANSTGAFIGTAFNWDDANKFIQSYEQDEDLSPVDRMADRAFTKEPVQVEQLDEKRRELLEQTDPEVKASVEKNRTSKRYENIWNKPVGVAGVDEGIVDASLNQALWYPINNLLQQREVDSRAVDMVDEMREYPQNFTTEQLVTLYYNLKQYPTYSGPYNRTNAFGYAQDRQKLRKTLDDLVQYNLQNDEFVKSLQSQIDDYRFIGHVALQNLRRQLNEYINDNAIRTGEEYGKEAVVFKDKMKVSGAELLKSDAIVEADGTILEIVSIAQDEDDPDLLDVYVKRGDKTAYYPLNKNDQVTVFRGSGVLPTPENLKRAEDVRKGIKRAPAKQVEILDGNGEGSEDSRVTEGKKEPENVKSPIQDRFLPVLNGLLARYEITDKALFDRLNEIANNPKNYEYSAAQAVVDRVKKEATQRPVGEVTATPEQRRFLLTLLNDRAVPEEQKQLTLKNLHSLSGSEAKKAIEEFKQLRAAPKQDGEGNAIEVEPNVTALEIALERGFTEIPEEAYAPFGTDLTGSDAPSKAKMVKVKQVIKNHEIDPDALKFFMEAHRGLSKHHWEKFIEQWNRPEFEKAAPTILTQAIPESEGGPSNKQLASIERGIMKGILPTGFVAYIMSEYKTKDKSWARKILDVTKQHEDNYDTKAIEYAMRNLLDLSDLRVPSNIQIPNSYAPLDENIGAGIPAEELQKLKNGSANKFLADIKQGYKNDPFWAPIIAALESDTELLDDDLGTDEEQVEKTRIRAARILDGRRTRRRMSRVIGSLTKELDLPAREISMGGKRFIQQAISDLIYLRGALDGRRKNVIQESPAEFDRRLKLISTALAYRPSATSYGYLNKPSEKTLRNLEDAASLVANLVGTYSAGQNDNDRSAVDKMIDINTPVPSMQRFTPPAFSGEALRPLASMTEWSEVKDFISKLVLYVFDFETTGIFDVNNPDIKNDPIQLAIAKAFNLAIEAKYNSYINPESKLSQFTLQTIGDGTGNKVTKTFLENQKSKLTAMQEFLDMVPEGSVLVGHNGFMFDMEVLNRTLREVGLPEYKFGGFIDTFGLSKHLMSRWSPENPDAPFRVSDYPAQGRYGVQVPSDSLEALVTYFGLSNNGRHEADADVVSTLEILGQLLDYAVAGRSEKGKTFDFEGTNNGWSEAEYEKALAEYNEKVSAYVIGRKMFNYAMLVNEMVDQNKRVEGQSQSSISNELLDKLQEIASRRVVGISDDRTGELPAARVVSELGAGSYVLDLATNRVGRSYGATGKGLVLVEFPAADYLVSGKTVLEKITPSSLYNATEALIGKDGMALDLGMTVTHSSIENNESGVFSGFDGTSVGVIKNRENLYRAPVNQISVLPYTGALPAEKESKETALDLIDELLSSKTLSKTFANALKKSINNGSYPRNALNNVISMLVNSREQRNIVDANKDTPSALPNSQSSAASSAVDRMRKAPKLTAKDFKDVELDTKLIEEYLPNVKLTEENLDILRAVIADAVNKGKSLNKTRNNVRIPAYAGTGKTTMLEAIVYLYAQMRPNDELLYLVFGKENQEEADKRLGSAGNALAKTLHSLAMNVRANKELKAKYNKIPELTGDNEGLNIRYSPEKVAAQFYIYEQWAGAIKEQYGVEIPTVALTQLAYDGLENWAMSADREISSKHFIEFHTLLALGNPSWAPGARKYMDAKDIDGIDYKKARPGTLIGEDGIFLGLQYVRKDADGKIIDVVDSLTLKNGRKIKNAEEYEQAMVVEFPENPARNEGFFIDQLIPIAQSFWEDIISPLDVSRSQFIVDQQFIVKNWSLGNVDLTEVTLDKNGKATSALGLDKIPNVLLLDEAQDINPVFVDILKRQVSQYDNGIQLVTVGDIFQSIFAFSGTVNALDEMPYDVSLPLTFNYRSAPELLGPANTTLNILGSEHELRSARTDLQGNIVEPNTLVVDDMMLITRTNAGILDAAMDLEVLDFYKNKTFAITPQLKKRLSAHLDTMRYLYWDSANKKKLKDLEDQIKESTEVLDEVQKSQQDDQLQYLKDQIKKNKNPGARRPSVLIGATWSSILNAIGNGTADADTRIIFTLMNKMEDPDDRDAEGKPKKMKPGKAINLLADKVAKYRTRNDSYQLPEEAGKAGFLGNGIAYIIRDGRLILTDGGPKEFTSEDAGVFDNRKILETLNFTRSEELETNPKTGVQYPKMEWSRPLRKVDDEQYIMGELTEVYNALSGADASVLFLTGHTSKGLEQSNVRLWKDWNPLYDGNDEENRPKPRKLAGESEEDYDKRVKAEEQSKIDRVMNRQEFNLFYVALTRAKQLLDLGGLAAFINNPGRLDDMRQALKKLENPDEGSAVDKMVDASAGDYYQNLNKGLMERKFSYLKSLELSLKTPHMQRIVPFQYATDADVQFEKEQTYREIAQLKANPNAQRSKDETSRYGLMELLAKLEAGEGIGSLSTEDRNRLFAYLGMSSLGSSGAYEADPTARIQGALAELDRRLGIEQSSYLLYQTNQY